MSLKKCGLCVFALMIMLSTAGCSGRTRFSDKELGIYEKIHHYYSKMDSYSARVRLKVKSNKTENEYVIDQYAKGADKTLTRVISPETLKGTETVTNGEISMMRLPGSETAQEETETSKDLDCSFVQNFLRYYYQSEETALEVSGSDATDGTTLLETELPPDSARRSRASMLVDNKTLAPKNITVYDMGGNIVFIAEFEKFVYNDTIKDEIFEIAS